MPSLLYVLSPELEPCFIRDTAPAPQYQSSLLPRLQDCPDQELASVRLVLRKLTALRIQNEQDAEDLVQETLLTMTVKYPKSNLQKGLLVWSMGILRKKVGNYYRRAQRYAPLDSRSFGDASGRQGDWTPHSPESGLRHRELRSLVERVVLNFPPRERQVLELCMAGLETHEIARRLQPESYQNVLNRLYRGRRRLAKELAKYGYTWPGVHRPEGTEFSR